MIACIHRVLLLQLLRRQELRGLVEVMMRVLVRLVHDGRQHHHWLPTRIETVR